MDRFHYQPLDALIAQLLRGPRRLRLNQLVGCEFLLSVIEPGGSYPFDFVRHALTGYRPVHAEDGDGHSLDGDKLIEDLIVAAEVLSEAADLVVETWPEAVWTAEALAKRLDVSGKTICRWRRRGLTGWRFRGRDQRSRLLFPERSVRRFVSQNAQLVTRGSSFSQLSKAEREWVVEHAREILVDGRRTVNAVARVISGETGRAVETIRLILKHYDEAHPGSGVFNRLLPAEATVDDRQLAVWEAYMDGAKVEALAERFAQPVTWVYGTITQMRALEMRRRRIEFIGSQEFEAPAAEDTILTPVPSVPLRHEPTLAARRVPAGLPPYLSNLFRIPLLTREGELFLFRKMNYLKYKARLLLDGFDPETVRAVELDHVEALLDEAAQLKNEIVQGNLRLVVSIAKRHLSAGQDLFELISDGNMSLMRAVDKFDYTRGFKFSTYASWAVIKNFARSVPAQSHHHERYQTGWDDFLDNLRSFQADETETDHVAAVRGTLDRMLATLEPRERSILRRRYGLEEPGEPQTLEQIGRQLGVSKERIRQIESRAMTKLRGGFEADVKRLLGA